MPFSEVGIVPAAAAPPQVYRATLVPLFILIITIHIHRADIAAKAVATVWWRRRRRCRASHLAELM
jgi:hypothetical protein